MTLQDTPPGPEESLALIRTYLASTRHHLGRSGFDFIFWGLTVALAALLHYGLARFSAFSQPWLPWPVLIFGGAIFTFARHARKSRKEGVVSTYGHFLRWLFSFGFAGYVLLSFLCLVQDISPMPFMMALTGLLEGVAGTVLRFRPLVWGAVLFFATAVAGVFLSQLDQLLLTAVAILAGYLWPGVLLTRKTRD